ncbi:MAG: hypothetical protein A2X47_13930 [Lentisphaerae bacterium GWF2_38_69]|nr:MAG: hypothetical protein A2X47_13930 [Lentisphaerae bacterium GWF2_38_69]
MLNHEKNFKLYLDDPNIKIDNNAAEQSMRKVVLGKKKLDVRRKSESREVHGCTLFFCPETCRALKINPQAYLEDIFRRLPGHPHKNLRELLPDQWAKAKSGNSKK